jgi:tryptophan-rich sensory protein
MAAGSRRGVAVSPYAVWVAFASVLNGSILVLN